MWTTQGHTTFHLKGIVSRSMISLHRDMHSVNVNVVEGKNPTREVFTPDFEAWRQQLTFFGIDLNHLESNPGCMSSLSWTTTMEGILGNSSLRYSLQSVINMAHFLLHDEEPQPHALIYWHEFIFENFSLNSKPANFSIFSVVSERKREETGHALYKGFPSKFTGITAIKVWPRAEVPTTVQFHVCYCSARRRNHFDRFYWFLSSQCLRKILS